uniref:Uncharacterized protein n=1 Tax=Caenorhabditis japonica TaxID=281687 RepID=A0A8R1DLI1_CAEJA
MCNYQDDIIIKDPVNIVLKVFCYANSEFYTRIIPVNFMDNVEDNSRPLSFSDPDEPGYVNIKLKYDKNDQGVENEKDILNNKIEKQEGGVELTGDDDQAEGSIKKSFFSCFITIHSYKFNSDHKKVLIAGSLENTDKLSVLKSEMLEKLKSHHNENIRLVTCAATFIADHSVYKDNLSMLQKFYNVLRSNALKKFKSFANWQQTRCCISISKHEEIIENIEKFLVDIDDCLNNFKDKENEDFLKKCAEIFSRYERTHFEVETSEDIFSMKDCIIQIPDGLELICKIP